MKRKQLKPFDTVILTKRASEPKPAPDPVPVLVVAATNRHPLELVGEGMAPFSRSLKIMAHVGRYSYLMQGDYKVHLLDGRNATPGRFVVEANAVLEAAGLPQIGGNQWLR